MMPGIDVSPHQPRIDWASVAAAGTRFAFIKASEGEAYQYTRWYREHARAARAEGIIPGAYHFLRWELANPERQAEIFARTVGDFSAPLLIAMDLEWCLKQILPDGTKVYFKRPPAEIADFALRWLQRLAIIVGRLPSVYTGKTFWSGYLSKSGKVVEALAQHSLWTVDYAAQLDRRTPEANEAASLAMGPKVPRADWQWDFWQWTGKGRVPGVTKSDGRTLVNCDRNWFRGTEDELLLIAGSA